MSSYSLKFKVLASVTLLFIFLSSSVIIFKIIGIISSSYTIRWNKHCWTYLYWSFMSLSSITMNLPSLNKIRVLNLTLINKRIVNIAFPLTTTLLLSSNETMQFTKSRESSKYFIIWPEVNIYMLIMVRNPCYIL